MTFVDDAHGVPSGITRSPRMPSMVEEALGHYPTPLSRLDSLCTEQAELWIKNDGLTHPEYGGNKVRKLERLLAAAERRGARRVVTFGAAGSHHVYATTLFARQRGLAVAAFITPQTRTAHAENMLRATAATDADLIPVPASVSALAGLRKAWRPGDFLIPPGGSGAEGVWGYVEAVRELAEQLAEADGDPDVIVAPLGSGGTVAGITAGVLREGLECRVIGVPVVRMHGGAKPLALALAARATSRDRGVPELRRLSRILSVDPDFVGDGYGKPTAEGQAAQQIAADVGLTLDPTYTAKAFAKALALVRTGGGTESEQPGKRLKILYWHTLSAVPPAAPLRGPLPAELERLLS
jgi:1-aminocyclopropane-1-carboxylate deaminase/D-cysteine desulfhydrase-like pyridoxal-dependent ACC family enzyme